ncbi:MAG TPA: carboxypeptidase-like regulatory domain-containing protein, partial [Pyrinomonadaceae bacterium]|nr:carboxypeptidase-like regulatory domain-containing protein [Pyrinomonadaceae bacterium]
MKKVSSLGVALALASLCMALAPSNALGNRGALATIAGSVKDSKGNPLAGAVISLIKDGAKEAAKRTVTGRDGSFSTKISPGRYGIRAIADGFSEVVFNKVEVRASQELIYRFNLEPAGSGRTLPERRRDREDVKWTLRSTQGRRSIFQAQEGEDETAKAVAAAEEAANAQSSADTDADISESKTEFNKRSRTQGVIESYFAANNHQSRGVMGMNFAVTTPATEHIDLIFVGQIGAGRGAPQRFEATGLVRAGQRHRLGVSAGGTRLGSAFLSNQREGNGENLGQLSVRAIDEWVVRDGVVIVLGLDYSRFLGASGAHSFTPRIGIQFDANARTRVKAAYAPGGEENHIESVAGFEGHQVLFNGANTQPIAYVDGRAIMERSRRLEIGIERVLDNESRIEATTFFDTTSGRGVGLMSMPISAFSGTSGDALLSIANQQGAARGIRVLYTRRLSSVWTASAGYSFGRGQRLSAAGITSPAELFSNGLFQTAAVQIGAGFGRGTHVRTVFRFSRDATVFAI